MSWIEKRLHEMFPGMDPNDVRKRTLARMWSGEIRCFRPSRKLGAIRYVLAEEADKFLSAHPEAIEIEPEMYEAMLGILVQQ
jgi:hypothetical protein